MGLAKFGTSCALPAELYKTLRCNIIEKFAGKKRVFIGVWYRAQLLTQPAQEYFYCHEQLTGVKGVTFRQVAVLAQRNGGWQAED
jgi:hypothetical protein